jgi:hypothetical protein
MSMFRLLIGSIVALLVLSACGEEGIVGATVITDGEHRIVSGERVRGELLVTGGDVLLEPGATVSGSVHMLGGSLTIGGTIVGNVSIMSGITVLLPEANITGDLVHSGGSLDQAREATVGGASSMIGTQQLPLSPAWENRTIAARLQTLAVTALIPMAVAYVALRTRPRAVVRASDAITHYPLVSGSFGLLTGVVGLVLGVFMVFTIILIPVALLLLIVFGLVGLAGWVTLGFALGRRMASWRRWPIQPPAIGVIGTGTLALLTHLIELVPIAGAVVPIGALAVSFGAVLLTRFGNRQFVPQSYEVDPFEPVSTAP